MLRPMPSWRWKSSKRRVPRQAWRMISRFQWSPSTAALRAIVHGHVEVSVRLMPSEPRREGCMLELGSSRLPFQHGTRRDDTQPHPHGEVRSDVVDSHILVMTVDRVAKKNAFTPKITNELADALTRLDEDPELFVGVLSFAGEHTTAGLEMPLFFTDEARAEAAQRKREQASEPVDPFGLGRRLSKPLVTAVQGITFTIGIEIALAGDIVVASSDARFCQLEPKRGLAPLGGATVRYVQRAGWGNAMYHLLRADEFDAAEAFRIGLVQEVLEPGRADRPGDRAGARDAAMRAAGVGAHDRQRPPRAGPRRADGDRRDPRDVGHRPRDEGLPGRDRVVPRATPGAVPGSLTRPPETMAALVTVLAHARPPSVTEACATARRRLLPPTAADGRALGPSPRCVRRRSRLPPVRTPAATSAAWRSRCRPGSPMRRFG